MTTAGCLVVGMAASLAPAPQRIPFDVVFDTAEPLGLRLDAGLTVLGFSRKPDGSMSHAEASGLIKPSDTLVAVNGKDVSSMDLQRTVMEIRDAELPKVLSFLPSHPGEDRAAEVQRRATSLEVRLAWKPPPHTHTHTHPHPCMCSRARV